MPRTTAVSRITAVSRAATTFCATALLGLGLALFASSGAVAEVREPLRTVLGGSFFPFQRSFAPPSERCQKAAKKRRARRDDNILNSQDYVHLRRIGCGGVSPW